jgi:hypothetical protein
MRNGRRWTFVPRTQGGCALYLLLGLLVVGYNGWQLTKADELAVLPLIAVLLGLAVVVIAIAGLVSPRLRSR